ncbi:MAG: hypothetical protein AB1589_09415 [Cyanobacteriota bacterium]
MLKISVKVTNAIAVLDDKDSMHDSLYLHESSIMRCMESAIAYLNTVLHIKNTIWETILFLEKSCSFLPGLKNGSYS